MTMPTTNLADPIQQRACAARQYQPRCVRVLLVAQTPPVPRPPDPPRYFYFPDVANHDHLFRAVAREALGVEPTRTHKALLLQQLCDRGLFLIDLKPDPLDPRPLSALVPALVERCRALAPRHILLIKADVYDAAYPALAAVDLPVVDVRIPFPSCGQQKRFAAAFQTALGRAGWEA